MTAAASSNAAIRPSRAHPGYWEYKGRTTLLVGGSSQDNLFQIDGLEAELDALAATGGNVVRNTMSDRDPGSARAFARIEAGADAGKYDLDRWGEAYWNRFERLLALARDRDVIVQIEVWDRFDHAREPWQSDPFNPANNVNYTYEETGLAAEYPAHPSKNEQPFFRTPPELDDNPVLIRYQQRFVDRMLETALAFPNVLYCMNNETSEEPTWGRYWLDTIRNRARQRGATVWATDMFDGGWARDVPDVVREQLKRPDVYPFVDISQVNAWRCTAARHWENLRRLRELNRDPVRPLNNTKVYVADTLDKGEVPRSTDRDGVASFWMDLLAGCASARFHRPPAGLGASKRALASIRAARLAEKRVAFWDLEPVFDWTGGRPREEAYLAAAPGRARVVLLPVGGQAELDISDLDGPATIEWLNLFAGKREKRDDVPGGGTVTLAAPGDDPYVALVETR